jgi:hypothetical protein
MNGRTACIGANCFNYKEGGGPFWVYLSWAFGLRALGWNVVWLELVRPTVDVAENLRRLDTLQGNLVRAGLDCEVALYPLRAPALAPELAAAVQPLEYAQEADVLIDFVYGTPEHVVRGFRRSVLVDIDPGLLQVWIAERQISVAPHDVYFSISEGVYSKNGKVPDCGIDWQPTAPCVALSRWPVVQSAPSAPFTTISHWYGSEWVTTADESYCNDKRTAFQPFLDVPRRTRQPLELAIYLAGDAEERTALESRGWRVRESVEVSRTPEAYQRYIQDSRGEFSCAKPSCAKLGTAWVSDRTLCYLASGKPAVVQHTGPSRFLPDAAGLFRFHTVEEAARYVDYAAEHYEEQSRLARALAEEYFDATKVACKLLERAL